ncbi:MAG: NADH:flavin oxidoreductase [Acidiferrobacteraceae bacterium]|nr:NADH:flavin oxidoreductase [Acidiferrobacteraceae bacterium]
MNNRDPRYDILFDKVNIGPVKTRNRFYQVPHCNGMGHLMPNSVSAMRAMKAEGGWGVVATEECDIHPSSDVLPYREARLWDQDDQKRLEIMVDAVHEHNSLAAVELVHNGHAVSNRYSRLPVMGVSDLPVASYDPVQAYAVTRRDITAIRRWHRKAALRAKDAGFDIIYVYAGHDLTLAQHFISRRWNQRCDEYGGSLENRVRLTRELLTDTIEAVGDRCAVAFRFAVDELIGEEGICCMSEGRDIVEMLAELPDLWDVNVSDWANDSVTARFSDEGNQEPYIAFVKQITSKPVVGVGRFTSPDLMVAQIQRGVLDLIGAARPSIADPFLPKKIEEGRLDDIRECIGCNICVSGDWTQSPIRCTQNPTMGEEWRSGWHPEYMNPRGSSASVLIVGAGPAGLEAAVSLGRRGYQVTIADGGDGGGRVTKEATLPGLSSWRRVTDYRFGQIDKLANVSFYPGSIMQVKDIKEFSAEHVVIATGSLWRCDGIGRATWRSVLEKGKLDNVFTPDDVLAGVESISSPVVIYDDDHYYMGGVIAQLLCSRGLNVTVITPGPEVSHWTQNTMEQHRIEASLRQHQVSLVCKKTLVAFENDEVITSCNSTGAKYSYSASSLVLVTARLPLDDLYFDLAGESEELLTSLPFTISRIGDCLAPSTIAAAVYDGHRYARQLDEKVDPDKPSFRREQAMIYSG